MDERTFDTNFSFLSLFQPFSKIQKQLSIAQTVWSNFRYSVVVLTNLPSWPNNHQHSEIASALVKWHHLSLSAIHCRLVDVCVSFVYNIHSVYVYQCHKAINRVFNQYFNHIHESTPHMSTIFYIYDRKDMIALK